MKKIIEYLCLLMFIGLIIVGTVGAGGYLRQNTAINVVLGPFLDDTDGKTAETGLTLSQADIRLSKAGGDFAQKNEATSCTHDELGYYYCPVDATDTNTLGRLKVVVHESGALPIWDDYTVLHANVYDVMFGSVAPSTLTASDNIGINWADVSNPTTTVGLSGTTVGTVTTLTGHTAQTGDAYSLLNTAAGEPAQGAPGVSLSPVDKLRWVYKFMRNRTEVETSGATDYIYIYNDAESVIDHKAEISDDGDTFIRDEWITGP